MTDFDHTEVADVDWASAACWLLSRRAYERVGPLDGGYFWSIEDVDYCQRVHRAGLRIVYFPQVSLVHDIGRIVDLGDGTVHGIGSRLSINRNKSRQRRNIVGGGTAAVKRSLLVTTKAS